MRAPSHHRVLLAVLAVVVVVVAGCSDPTPAAKVPRRSPTSTTTATAATVSPSPVKLAPEQEVEAAVRTYYAELTRAAQTNDTSKLKKLVHKGCPCYNAIRIIDRNKKDGKRTPKARFKLESVNVHDVIRGTAGAEVYYDVTAYDVIDASGDVQDHVDAKRRHLDLSLVTAEGTWMVSNLFDLEGP